MDLDIALRDLSGDPVCESFKDGMELDDCTDTDMEIIYDEICRKMPVNHTVFKYFNEKTGQWRVEIYESARDFKMNPVWCGIFNRIPDEELRRRYDLLRSE